MTPNSTSRVGAQRSDCGSTRLYGLIVIVVIAAAVVLRFVALDRYPLPIHQDELSNIYDGYSIATTGADRAGVRWPVLVRGMGPGDYRPALYAYLAAVTTRLGGFSTWAGRLPAAVLGSLTVVLVFLLARRLLGRSGGLLALLFATFSPILIQYGRQAHEGACLPPFFSVLILFLLYRALERREPGGRRRGPLLWIAGAGLAVGLSASAYGAQRLTAPLFGLLACGLILLCVGWQQRAFKRSFVMVLVFVVMAGLGALPQIYAMIEQPGEFFVRAETVGCDWHSGPRWWAERLIAGYAAHLDPRGLLFAFGEYGELSVALLSVAASPFLYLGLAVVLYRGIARRETGCFLLLAGVMICILPAAASTANLGIMRASGVWSLYPLVCALGAVGLGSAARAVWRQVAGAGDAPSFGGRGATGRTAVLATTVLSIAIVAVGVRNITAYLARPDLHGVVSRNHLVRIGQWLADHDRDYQRVYIDAPDRFAYLYVSAFAGTSPAQFQRTPREGCVSSDGWEDFHRFGRYRFAELAQAERDWAASNQNESWLFVNTEGETVNFRLGQGEGECRALALAPDSFPAASR